MKHFGWILLLALGCSSSSEPAGDDRSASVADGAAGEETAAGTTSGQGDETPEATSTAGTGGQAAPANIVTAGGSAVPVHGAATLDVLFDAFVKSPDRDSWLAVREGIVTSGAYNPYSDEMALAGDLMMAGRHAAAVEKLTAAMPNLLLSPSAHQMLAVSYEELRDEASAAAERKAAQACLTGLLATGAGSQDSPWQVSRPSDEYDVLAHLEKRMQQQELRNDQGRSFDLMECEDGTQLWFDITTPFAALGQSLK